jgi:hypothetical protein
MRPAPLWRRYDRLSGSDPAAETVGGRVQAIQMLVDRATSPRRFFVMLVGAFAGLGLLLAALGIYGVISYSVTQRTQEIGVRMALGATTSQVQLSVIAKTLRLALIGISWVRSLPSSCREPSPRCSSTPHPLTR